MLNLNICRNEEQLTDKQNIQRCNIYSVSLFINLFIYFLRKENKQKLRYVCTYMDYWRGLYPTPKLLEGSGPPRPLLWRSPCNIPTWYTQFVLYSKCCFRALIASERCFEVVLTFWRHRVGSIIVFCNEMLLYCMKSRNESENSAHQTFLAHSKVLMQWHSTAVWIVWGLFHSFLIHSFISGTSKQ